MTRFRWKNISLGAKLGIGFSMVIAIFFALGILVLINMRAIQKKSNHLGTDYIPMVGILYNLEHFTHEAMHAILGFSLSEEDHYYQAALEHIKRINEYYQQADSLIRHSDQLRVFEASGQLIQTRINEFVRLTQEMATVNLRVRQLRNNLDSTFREFNRFSTALLIKENQDFRERILEGNAPTEELVVMHRMSKMANVIIDKGNVSHIETMKALAQKDPGLIEDVYRQHFRFLFSLLVESTKIADARALRMIQGIERNVRLYQDNMFALSESLRQARLLEKRVEENAFAALLEAHRISVESIRTTTNISNETIELLSSSTRFLLFGLFLSLILGLIFAIGITRAITVPLFKSVAFAGKVASGDLNAEIDVDQKDETGALAKALKGMLENLRKNITARKHAEQNVLNTIIETEQKERKRFAEDLHDGLGPLLSTLKLYINSFESGKISMEQRQKLLTNAIEVINEAIRSTRQIANNLMPSLLQDFGLKVAVESFCDNLQKSNAISVDCSCEGFSDRLPKRTEAMLFNTIMELTNNTLRHSGAETITLNMQQQGTILKINYSDNGCGCNLAEALSHHPERLGLRNIVSRIESINGEIRFESSDGKGFAASIRLDTNQFTHSHATNN